MTSTAPGAVGPPTLPSGVEVLAGRGGLSKIAVRTGAATAEIHLQGAQVTAWAPRGAHPVLWMSEQSAHEPGRALRGGIPICFPWFGPSPAGSGPQHGFARTLGWTLLRAEDEGEEVRLTLGLDDSPATRVTAWPYRFSARLTVGVGTALGVSLEIGNRGEEPFTFTEALHTYLEVSDVRDVEVSGLEHMAFVDKVAGGGLQPAAAAGAAAAGAGAGGGAGGVLRLSDETDRVYTQPDDGLITVTDAGLSRAIEVRSANCAHAVVWNPWSAKAATMADVPADGWISFLCVESANALDQPVNLQPGERHSISTLIAVRQP